MRRPGAIAAPDRRPRDGRKPPDPEGNGAAPEDARPGTWPGTCRGSAGIEGRGVVGAIRRAT